MCVCLMMHAFAGHGHRQESLDHCPVCGRSLFRHGEVAEATEVPFITLECLHTICAECARLAESYGVGLDATASWGRGRRRSLISL